MEKFKLAKDIVKKSLTVEEIQEQIDRDSKTQSSIFFPHYIYISDDIKLKLLEAGYTLNSDRQAYQIHGLTISW